MYLDVVDIGYINLMVWDIWSELCALLSLRLLIKPSILICELVITVVDILQRDNCIELAYIEDVEQNILFSILV